MTHPSVSVVITAYDVEPFVARAVESALAQDYPGPVEVVVVDDGSTDGTPEVLASFGGAIRVHRKPNGGLSSAVEAGLELVTGELVAILDGDDEAPPDRLSAQVGLLRSRPEVGLVHGDMRVVGPAGETLHPSFFAAHGIRADRGDVLGRLMRGNFVSGGASTFRASYLPLLLPFPTAIAWPDWYVAVRLAECAPVDHVDGAANLYRLHGANMGLGATGERQAGLRVLEVRKRRWMLRELWRSRASVADLAACAATMELQCNQVAQVRGCRPTAVAPVSAEDEAAAEAAFAAGLAASADGQAERGARLFARALGHDPWHGGARAELAWSVHLLQEAGTLDHSGAPLPGESRTTGARTFVVAASAAELVRRPALLAAYARAFGPDDDATLVALAPGVPEGELGGPLAAAVAAAGVPDDRLPDVLVLGGDAARAATATLRPAAVLSDEDDDGGFLRAPVVSSEHAAVLRARASALPVLRAVAA